MDPPPPGFVRVSITCRDCGREDVLDMQRGIMTLKRLRRSWRRCAECQSGDIEIAASSGGHRPCPDAEQDGTVMPAAHCSSSAIGDLMLRTAPAAPERGRGR
jgi:hypothetical protein